MLLAACSQGAGEAPAADPDDLIECAVAGAAAFVRDCAIPATIAGDERR